MKVCNNNNKTHTLNQNIKPRDRQIDIDKSNRRTREEIALKRFAVEESGGCGGGMTTTTAVEARQYSTFVYYYCCLCDVMLYNRAKYLLFLVAKYKERDTYLLTYLLMRVKLLVYA